MAIKKRTGDERPRPLIGKTAKDNRIVRFVDLNKNLGEVESEIQRVEDLIGEGGGGETGVKRYIAALEQTGTDAPVATVIRNDFDGEIVWSRVVVGIYLATLTGIGIGKVRIIPPSNVQGDTADTIDNYGQGVDTDNSIYLITTETNKATGVITFADGLLLGVGYSYIEIIKYED